MDYEIWVERNLKAKELEREGFRNEAIALYKANVDEGFDGSFPYERLVQLYQLQCEYGKSIRVAKKFLSMQYREKYKNEELLEIFKREIEQNKIMKKALPEIIELIKNHTGILQTEIYSILSKFDKTILRTVFYGLERARKIKRLKAGRSYSLSLF